MSKPYPPDADFDDEGKPLWHLPHDEGYVRRDQTPEYAPYGSRLRRGPGGIGPWPNRPRAMDRLPKATPAVAIDKARHELAWAEYWAAQASMRSVAVSAGRAATRAAQALLLQAGLSIDEPHTYEDTLAWKFVGEGQLSRKDVLDFIKAWSVYARLETPRPTPSQDKLSSRESSMRGFATNYEAAKGEAKACLAAATRFVTKAAKVAGVPMAPKTYDVGV